MDKTTHVYFPKWVVIFYGVLAAALIPWITNLAQSLPSSHEANHWDAVWVGFDMFMLFVLGLTIVFALKKMIWVTLSATALGTLFIVDAWFDIMTSQPGHEQKLAIIFGTMEVLLALLTFRLVYHVIRHTSSHQTKVKLTAKRPPGN